MASFKSGDKIGKYTMVELIGHGGMASVYLGMDEVLKRNVAIKILHPYLENRQEAKERFRREAQAIAKISHPNIVEIYDYSGEDASQSYIVTQLVSGGNLKDLQEKQGSFPPEIAAAIALQVAEGLRVAHAGGVVHRDIKPENLLIDKDGTVKVADFGIAHLADAHDMTATGQILGSPYYMSPEQVLGDHLDERSDIFSFGSLLYWLVTGKAAFEAANPHAVLRCIVDKEVEDADRLAPAVGRKLGEVIRGCQKKSPDERYRSFDPVIQSLKEVLEQSGVDDARQEIRLFIASPDPYRRDRREKSIAIWSDKAQEIEQQGKVQESMDLYNRVLALDPDNERVLERLKSVRSAQSRRKAVRWTVGVVLLFALLLGGFFLGTAVFPQRPGTSEKDTEAATGMEGENGAQPEKKLKKAAGGGVVMKKMETADGSKPRKVRFVPFPKTVTISVDGKLLGDYFSHQQTELAVGPHTIRFDPVDIECCEPAEWTVVVTPAGAGNKEQTIGKRLVFKPGQLMVFSDKPGDVFVGVSKLGRTGEFLSVHLGAPSKSVEVTVRADGCEPWKGTVTVRAGKQATVKSALQCGM
jgi:serine/threonine protein kinase